MKITTTKKELQKIIREERRALLKEASMEQIQSLNGKEVSMRYRKSTGETKTYYGRVVASPKAGPGKFFMGVLNQGLKLFKADGVIGISPASLSELAEYFNEMCKDECIDEVLEGGPGSGKKGSKPAPKPTPKPKGGYNTKTFGGDTGVDADYQEPSGDDGPVYESVPKAWSGTAKAMSKHKEIDNPWALTNWMAKHTSAKPHYEPTKKEGAVCEKCGTPVLKPQFKKEAYVWKGEECSWCGKEVPESRGKSEFCSTKCRDEHNKSLPKSQWVKEAEEDDAELINKAPGQGAKDWYEEGGPGSGPKKGAQTTAEYEKWKNNLHKDPKYVALYQAMRDAQAKYNSAAAYGGGPKAKQASQELFKTQDAMTKFFGNKRAELGIKEGEAGMFSHRLNVGDEVIANGKVGRLKKVWAHPTLGMVGSVLIKGQLVSVPVEKLRTTTQSQTTKGGLQETPVPTSLGTRNVQQVKKCPTCEGIADLKIGCPTCGGKGRVDAQDKFQEEYTPQPQGKFQFFYKAPDEKSFKQVKSWLKAMGIPYKLDGTHFLAEPSHRAAITKYMRADDPSYKWPQ